MGVKGLLPLLKSIHKPCNLKEFAGQTLGVDAYGWLHRGTIACAIELAQGKPTRKHIDNAMYRVRMLIHFGIRPYIVFDGDYLPSKKHTEEDRAARRKEAKKQGLALLSMGKTSQAYQELQKAIDVTPEMARQFMDELDRAKVDFVVAPYEADAQLVYLEKLGVIDGIVSEDSDMLVFGAKTLVTKLDQYGGCVVIHRKDFTSCWEVSFLGWSDSEFRWMSILSGCDYLASIGSIGLKTAHRLIRQHKTVERVVKAIQFEGRCRVPPDYLQSFRDAELTFLYQWVYCPNARKLVNLTEPPGDVLVDTLTFIGKSYEAPVAQDVAHGRLHPHTKRPLVAAPLPASRYARRSDKIVQTSTPELKKHHSIESFFKPKRTPLAELDPNAFTPSPSQQRLLEQEAQENSDRDPPPPDRRVPLGRSLTDVHRSQSARRAVTDIWPSPLHTSPKRQRLCTDPGKALALTFPKQAMTEQSRFFPRSTQSPSVARANRKETKRSKEINIWSDDSIEDALLQIPDVAEPVKRFCRKIQVFKDEQDCPKETTTAKEAVDDGSHSCNQQESQSTAASIETAVFSADEGVTQSPLTSFESNHPAGSTTSVLDPIEESPQRIPASSPPPPPPPSSGDGLTDDLWQAASEGENKSTSVKEMLSAYASGITGSTVKGSEDLLVRDSESEEDPFLNPPGGSETSKGFGIDMCKFAFQG